MTASGQTANVLDVDQVRSLVGYDAAVIGSAVYAGRWVPEARAFVETHSASLKQMPVWLFSSGPLGPHIPPTPVEPAEVERLVQAASARQHMIFGGRIERKELNLLERLMVRVVKASGDARDWSAIRDWAREISGELGSESITDRPAAEGT
jgi:menaquinone-dependent protoporphyrinogen oxidase